MIMQVEQMQPWPYHGPLFWLPADGSPAVPLAANGANLAWGQ